MDDHRTFNQRRPAGEAGLVGKTRCIRTEYTRRRLFLHAKIVDDFIQELITQTQIVAYTRFTIVKIQKQLITKHLMLRLRYTLLSINPEPVSAFRLRVEGLICFRRGFNRRPPLDDWIQKIRNIYSTLYNKAKEKSIKNMREVTARI